MKGLLLKDLYILKHAYFKNLTLVLVIYTALGLAMKMSFFFNIMGWMFGFYVVGLLSLDKASNWDFYASALPLSKPQLVGEKFILLLLCALAGFAYGMVMSPLIQWRMGTPITESLLVALIVTLVVLLYFGIMMPFVYKFGVEKAAPACCWPLQPLAASLCSWAAPGAFPTKRRLPPSPGWTKIPCPPSPC